MSLQGAQPTYSAYLTPQVKCRRICIRPLCSEFVRKLFRSNKDRVVVALAHPWHDRLVEIVRCVENWRDRRRVVVDAAVHEHAAVTRVDRWRGSESVDAPRLDIDGRDLGAVVLREDRELDRAAPRRRLLNRRDVLVAGASAGLRLEQHQRVIERAVRTRGRARTTSPCPS